jgi:hypothetical protein
MLIVPHRQRLQCALAARRGRFYNRGDVVVPCCHPIGGPRDQARAPCRHLVAARRARPPGLREEQSRRAAPDAHDRIDGHADSGADRASSSASAEPGAQPAIREALGTIAKIEVMKLDEALQRTKLFTISKPKEVEEVLKAINVDQTPGGHLRRCPDQLVLVMQDESGTAKGEVGLCDVDTLGPEFTPTGGGRKAIQIADEETFRKDLKLPKSAPKK